jgi:23S rRNA (uracil1939-C5)-methyltransferase
MGDTAALDIARLGAQGDGVADTPAGPVFVPYVLPGERVQAEVRGERARLVAVLNPSPNRIAPICRHFTHCGGCALQHVERGTYLAWKRDCVATAFGARGIMAPVGHVVTVGLGARPRDALGAAYGPQRGARFLRGKGARDRRPAGVPGDRVRDRARSPRSQAPG